MTDLTLTELRAELSRHAPELPIVFTTESGEIAGGFHVTELKHQSVRSIDCGGNRHAWEEVVLELLDGSGGAHMALGRLASILDRSLAEIPELAVPPVSVDYAPANRGLRRHAVASVAVEAGRLVIALREGQAQCKPRSQSGARPTTSGQGGCCGRAAA